MYGLRILHTRLSEEHRDSEIFCSVQQCRAGEGRIFQQIAYYNNISLGAGSRAGDCIGCGRCEEACPQHLPIRKYLKEVAEKLEKENAFPTRKPEKK